MISRAEGNASSWHICKRYVVGIIGLGLWQSKSARGEENGRVCKPVELHLCFFFFDMYED